MKKSYPIKAYVEIPSNQEYKMTIYAYEFKDSKAYITLSNEVELKMGDLVTEYLNGEYENSHIISHKVEGLAPDKIKYLIKKGELEKFEDALFGEDDDYESELEKNANTSHYPTIGIHIPQPIKGPEIEIQMINEAKHPFIIIKSDIELERGSVVVETINPNNAYEIVEKIGKMREGTKYSIKSPSNILSADEVNSLLDDSEIDEGAK